MPKISDWTRIATEGATTDGRVMERDWIDQMAAGYNPATYTATINCEHIRGFSAEPPFNSYGRVTELKAEDFKLSLDGKEVKRRGLYAKLEANDNLVATVTAGQKLFTSCEVAPNFAATGKAGLVGLAITDNPASLGTEAMKFAAGQVGDASPFAARKKDKDNLFTAAEAATLALSDAPADPAGLLAGVKAIVDAAMLPFRRNEPAPEPQPEPKPPANDNDMAAFATAMGTMLTEAVARIGEANTAAITAVRNDFATLKTELEATEQPRQFRRAPAAGGNGGDQYATDC